MKTPPLTIGGLGAGEVFCFGQDRRKDFKKLGDATRRIDGTFQGVCLYRSHPLPGKDTVCLSKEPVWSADRVCDRHGFADELSSPPPGPIPFS